MEPPSGYTSSLSFGTEALGEPQTRLVQHRGLEYRGEVIVAEAVNPAWGWPLEGDLSFRAVFFTVPRRIPAGQIQHPCIAMAVPRHSPDQVRQSLGRELRAVHETRERYLTVQDPDALALRRSLEERESSLRGELARRYGVSYSQGRIYTHTSIRVRARDIFAEESIESWSDRMAAALLQLAFPSLPIDYQEFPHTLTTDTIKLLYRGLFLEDDEAVGAVQAFGPGLGLTRREAPTLFDPSECRVIDVIQRELETRRGEMPAQELIGVLTHAHGITRFLAALYIMVFVRHSHADVEVGPGHGVENRHGGPFLSDRITWDLVPELSFSEHLAAHLGMLRLQPSVAWDTILPYATLLVQEMESSGDSMVVAKQECQLLEALKRMAPEIAGAKEALTSLEASLGRSPMGALEALNQLQVLCSGSTYREFYSIAQENFRGPSGLGEALDLYQRLGRLVALAPVIAQAKLYLDHMTFGRDHREFSLERDSLVARIDPDSLMANPSLWGSITESFQLLRAGYTNAYVVHHARYYQAALELRHRLDRARPQFEALARFNEIPELGEPVGTEVPQLSQEVAASIRVCTLGGNEPSIQDMPHCQVCQLPMGEETPRRDAESLFGAIEQAMREYNRRLSSHGVRQVLAQPTREQIDKFIDLLHVADPSALANVLDDEVVEFLRRFIRNR